MSSVVFKPAAHNISPLLSLRTFCFALYLSFKPMSASASCQNYFLCNTGGGGLGDQLEHYIYCLYCAKLLNASVVLNGFHGGPAIHQGTSEYRDAATLLGIVSIVNTSYVEHLNFRSLELSFPEILSLHNGVYNGSLNAACNIVYISDIYSCPDVRSRWCDFLPTYDSLKAVLWKLRHSQARQKCVDRGLGFNFSSVVNIVWHVRVGDICLHCNDLNYYSSLYSRLLTASSTLSTSHHLVFESQGKLEFLEQHEMFKWATFNYNSTLMETICRFLTSDVLITSGSSFPPFVAAFAPPWTPIVLEERRKEAPVGSSMAHHFFNEEEAVLLDDGEPLLSVDEFSAVFESVLNEKLFRQRAATDRENR